MIPIREGETLYTELKRYLESNALKSEGFCLFSLEEGQILLRHLLRQERENRARKNALASILEYCRKSDLDDNIKLAMVIGAVIGTEGALDNGDTTK